MEMNKQELESENSKKGSCNISWIKIFKMAIIALIVILLGLLAKDYFLKEEISIGVETPSVAEYSIIRGFDMSKK